MNKHERFLAGRKRAAQLARKCGWTGPFENLPEATRHAFISKGEIRISGASDKKGFSRSPLGHQYGGRTHLKPRMAREREELRTAWGESDEQPTKNKFQREIGRYVKRPTKNLNTGFRQMVISPERV